MHDPCGLLVIAACAVLPAIPAGATDETSFEALRIATVPGFPVYVTAAPGDRERLFVVSLEGFIYIIKDGRLQERPFLDILDRVRMTGEGGLLSMAFHCDWASNGSFYVCYTRQGDNFMVVERYRVSDHDRDLAKPDSATPVLAIPAGGMYHRGGWVGFGPEGHLYVSVGDNNAGNPQDPEDWRGKILRIDVDVDAFPKDDERNYASPPDNPFVNGPGLDEVWALGLRNPWRCSFDRRTGDFFIGDVGDRREELDFQLHGTPGGLNYGWPCWDGSQCHDSGNCEPCDWPGWTAPFHDYAREDIECRTVSVMCGYVYRGAAVLSLQGRFVFGDLCGRMWLVTTDGQTVKELVEITANIMHDDGTSPEIVSFGEDADGELYFVAEGDVYKLVPGKYKCAIVSDFTARCDPAGMIHAHVLLRDASNDGGSLVIRVNQTEFDVPVIGRHARLTTEGVAGANTVTLVRPWRCRAPIRVVRDSACCLPNGRCRELPPELCLARDGVRRLGRLCDEIECPQVGACCLDDRECELMLEQTCDERFGQFFGEGSSCAGACPCPHLKTVRARCSGSGTVHVDVIYKDESQDGQDVEVQINDRNVTSRVFGRKARIVACCFVGQVDVELADPHCGVTTETYCEP